MTRLLLLAALILTGCYPEIPMPPTTSVQPPGAHDAISYVWQDLYQRSDNPPPVRYVKGADLTCDGGTGFRSELEPGKCLGGLTVFIETPSIAGHMSSQVVFLAWPDGSTWATAEICHELNHVLVGPEGGQHADESWLPYGRADFCKRMLVEHVTKGEGR